MQNENYTPSIRSGHRGSSCGSYRRACVDRNCTAQQRTWRAGDPFSIGVASGSPRSDGFVLWTRLAPRPLSTDTGAVDGMSGEAVTVAYEISDDPSMRRVVQRGEAIADAKFGFSVHADVTGLQPGPPYWYRFI